MRKKIIISILSTATLVISFFAWWSIDRAVNVPEASQWIAPIIWFTLLFAILCLDVILIREAHIEMLLFVFSAALSFVFARSVGHLAAFFLGFILLFLASNRINRDLKANIKINLWKSMRTGRLLILTALALVITSQYYFEAINLGAKNMIPRFKIDDFSGKATSKILTQINPNLAVLQEEGLTVDELLLKVSKQNQPPDASERIDEIIEMEYGNFAPSEKREIRESAARESEKILLQEGRKKLAEYAGRDLTGREKVADVFSEIVNNKINEFLQPGVAGPEGSSLVPLVIATLLFLTIVSLGPILGSIGMFAVVIIFILLVKFKAVSIRKEMKEVEIIE